MEKSKETKLIEVLASIFLLCIVGVASFAYFGSFNVDLNNNVAVNVNSVSPGNATFTSNATQLNLQVPAANMSLTASNNSVAAFSNTATLTINLTGAANLTTTCTYDIVYEYDSSSYIYGGTGTNHVSKNSDKEITLQVSNVNGTNNFASEKNFDYDSNWSGLKRTLVSGATIESNGTLTTQNISIIGKYYNLTVSQSSLEGKPFTGKIYVTNNKCETSVEKSVTALMSTSTPDVYDENGMRYEGANPNNYICLDNQKKGSCSDNALLFRIIGLFDEEYSTDGTTSAGTKKLLKVIGNVYKSLPWDNNNYVLGQNNNNNSNNVKISFLNKINKYNILQLAAPIASGENNWEASTLKNELNSIYLTNLISKNKVNNILNDLIANTKWHLGGNIGTTSETYAGERDTSAIYSGNPSNIYAKVGIMYPSDYGYATVGGSTTNKSVCRNQLLFNWYDKSYSDCKNNDWLFSNEIEWTIMPSRLYSGVAYFIYSMGGIDNSSGVDTYMNVRPTFYLDASSFKIVGGTGTSVDPYHIG